MKQGPKRANRKCKITGVMWLYVADEGADSRALDILFVSSSIILGRGISMLQWRDLLHVWTGKVIRENQALRMTNEKRESCMQGARRSVDCVVCAAMHSVLAYHTTESSPRGGKLHVRHRNDVVDESRWAARTSSILSSL
jgi:hypothetical protein